MSHTAHNQAVLQDHSNVHAIGITSGIDPLPERSDVSIEIPDVVTIDAAQFPQFEVERLNQHGIEGVHIYFK